MDRRPARGEESTGAGSETGAPAGASRINAAKGFRIQEPAPRGSGKLQGSRGTTSVAISSIDRFIFSLSSQSWPIIRTVPKPPVTSYSSCRRAVTVSGLPTMPTSSTMYSRVTSASGHGGVSLGQVDHVGDPQHAAEVHERVAEGPVQGVLARLGVGLADVDAARDPPSRRGPGPPVPPPPRPSQYISHCRVTLCGGAMLMLIGRNPRLPPGGGRHRLLP